VPGTVTTAAVTAKAVGTKPNPVSRIERVNKKVESNLAINFLLLARTLHRQAVYC
jgi:hypothetical protein